MSPHPALLQPRRGVRQLRGAGGPPPSSGAKVVVDGQARAVEAANTLRLSRWVARRASGFSLRERRCFRPRDLTERLLLLLLLLQGLGVRVWDCDDHRAAGTALEAPAFRHHVARAAHECPHHADEWRRGSRGPHEGRRGTKGPEDLSQNGDGCVREAEGLRGTDETDSLRARADGDECERGRGAEGQS